MKYLVFASLLAVGAFASKCHPKYDCCKGCDVVTTDEDGEWGIEGNRWCAIDNSVCGAIKGYPTCKECNIKYTDDAGNWGVENNKWCFIPQDNCKKVYEPLLGQDVVIPVIHLISESGTSAFATEPVSKHIANGKKNVPEPYYENCELTLETPDGKTPLKAVKSQVKVRGNYTTNYPKKPLRINFAEPTNLLGLHNGEKYKSWVLLAEYKDGSMLRNKSAFAMSRPFLGEDNLFVSDAILVELRINDEYFGVYVLGENQQIDHDRVDITKAAEGYEGTDIGYMLELDGGYAYAEPELNKFTMTYNDNAPLTPFDGLGGSNKTIYPNGGGSGGFGGFDFGGFDFGGWGGNRNNTGGWGGNRNNTGGWGFGGWGGNRNRTTTLQPLPEETTLFDEFEEPTEFEGFEGIEVPTEFEGFEGIEEPTEFDVIEEPLFDEETVVVEQPSPSLKKRQFGGSKKENMTIKSEIYSAQQRDFIASYINNAYKIIYEAAYNDNLLKFNDNYTDVVSAEGMTAREVIENVVDVNSLADMYIISEMTCDADLYYSSFYMDVDFGPNGSKKLRFECPWDFDSGLGNKERCTDGQGYFAGNAIPDNGGMVKNKINPWLAVLMYQDWYQDIIRAKWTKHYDNGVFDDVIEMINTDTTVAKNAIDRNYALWDNINNNGKFRNELSREALKCKTQEEHAAFLARWIKARSEFVNSCWHE